MLRRPRRRSVRRPSMLIYDLISGNRPDTSPQIVACKYFSEVYDLLAGLVDDCALGDPSGQADLFSYFYSIPDSDGDSPTGAPTTAASIDTAPTMITTPAAPTPTTDVQTQIESMTCKATDSGTLETASAGALPTVNSTPLPTSSTVDSSTAMATSG